MAKKISFGLSTLLAFNLVATPLSAFAEDVVPVQSIEQDLPTKQQQDDSSIDDELSSDKEETIEPTTGEEIINGEQPSEDEEPIEQNDGKEKDLKSEEELHLELINNTDFQINDNGDGTASITGYNGTNTDIVIPPSIKGLEVVEIADKAFKGKEFTSVIVEGNIKRVGKEAFYNTILNGIKFNGNVDFIDKNGFGSSEIGYFTVEGNVETFGQESFMESKIGPININGNIGSTEEASFFKTEIGDIEVEGNWGKIGDESFSDSELGNIIIKGTVNEMGTTTFRESKIKNFTLKQDINELGAAMFLDATIAEFLAEGNIGHISNSSFLRANINSLRILGKVTSTEKYSIQQSLINSIEFGDDVGDIGEGTFLQGKFNDVTFRGNVGSLGDSTFLHSKVENLTFEGDIGSIGSSSFISDDITQQYIGTLLVKGNIGELMDSSFLNINVKIGINVEGSIGKIGNNAFLSTNIPLLHVKGDIGSIGNGSFLYTKGSSFNGVKEIIVEGRVGSLGNDSFIDVEMDKFIVRKGIGDIGNAAFILSDIKELDIFSNTRSIGNTTFQEAKFYSTLEVPNTVINVGPNAFRGIDVSEFIYKAQAPIIPPNMFMASRVLTYLEVPDPVVSIESGAFRDVALEKVKSNKNLESIGDEAFLNHNMSCVTLYPKVKTIGIDAFKSSNVNPADFTIWGDKDSAAEAYAQANGHTFKENDIFSNDCNPAEWAIKVEYVDEQGTLLDSKTISKPTKGNHTEAAKAISGYTVKSNKTVTVEVTNANPNHTITFVYSKNSSPKPPPEIVFGTVTVKYVNEEGKVLDTKVVSNVPLGTHTEQAKQIAGYTVKDDQTITIENTNKNREHTITFVYSKNNSPKPPEMVQGTVIVKYMDENETVLDSKVVNNLPLGSHIEQAKEFTGYEVMGSKQQSVEITQNNTIFTITFTYKKVDTPQPESPGPNQPEPVTPPLVTTPGTTEPLQENPREDVENQKGQRVIRDEGNGLFTTVPHYLDNHSKLKITTKYNYGLLITDRVSVPFKDIDGLFSYQEVEDLYNYLIVKGTTPSTYSPKKDLKRGEFSVMLARALELRTNSKKYKFKDVNVYKKEVQALYEAGIITGYTDGSFGESNTLTRQEAAAMIVRMLNYMGVDTNVKTKVELADMSQISEYAQEAVQYLATQNVLVSGYGTKFNPKRNLTRAEMAKVLMRALRISDWY
ncbi:leucine-rich repeat protein [Lysinibacillus sp. K60]|uniref:leucine-rich repeat protein n=1 Tax=Lysinibacillus sp. K60 TaxID=2720027 RepID=UPI001C8B2AFB|nr:leucine-rich repeat protein [Lysinibacillus sp. K60]MBX8945910.1 leucine-rich repeat protein [Lysinibacillus sp. K60]